MKFVTLNKKIQKIMYPDVAYNPEFTEYSFTNKLLSEPDNLNRITDLMTAGQTNLLISPCGSGKTFTLSQAADILLADPNYDSLVLFLTPSRCQTLQVSSDYGFTAITRQDSPKPCDSKLAVVYEKLHTVKKFCEQKRADWERNTNPKKLPLRILMCVDECQMLTTSLQYRQSVVEIVDFMNSKIVDSTLFMTATPRAVCNFAFNRIVAFNDTVKRQQIKNITLKCSNDVNRTIYNEIRSNPTSYARINSYKVINELKKKLLADGRPSVALTAEEKKSRIEKQDDGKGNRKAVEVFENETLNSIIYNSDLNNKDIAILATSLVDSGTNFVKYELPHYIFSITSQVHACVDDIEQSANRFRAGLQNATIITRNIQNTKVKFLSLQDQLSRTIWIIKQKVTKIQAVRKTFIDAGSTEQVVRDAIKLLLLINEDDFSFDRYTYYDLRNVMDDTFTFTLNMNHIFKIAYDLYNLSLYYHPEHLKEELEETFGVDVDMQILNDIIDVKKKDKESDKNDGEERANALAAFNHLITKYPFLCNSIDSKNPMNWVFLYDNYAKKNKEDCSAIAIMESKVGRYLYKDIIDLRTFGYTTEETLKIINHFTQKKLLNAFIKDARLLSYLHNCIYHGLDANSSSPFVKQYYEEKLIYDEIKKRLDSTGQKTIAYSDELVKSIVETLDRPGITKCTVNRRIMKMYQFKNLKTKQKRNITIERVKTIKDLYQKIDFKEEQSEKIA